MVRLPAGGVVLLIDFRFHLISLVAVFVALAVGIMLGSGFIGDVALEDLEGRLDRIRTRNEAVNAENAGLEDRLAEQQAFAEAVQPQLTQDALRQRQVVMITFDGVSGDARDGVSAAIGEAGGEVVGAVTITDRMELPGDAERDQLGLIVESLSGETDDLLRRTGEVLGVRMANASEPGSGAARDEILAETLIGLEDAGFVSIEGVDPEEAMPAGASIVVVGGSEEPAPYDVAFLAAALTSSVAAAEKPVAVGETSDSTWGIVDAIRDDDTISRVVTTVDNVETTWGQVAIVLGLAQEIEGGAGAAAGHYGLEGEPIPLDQED